MFKTKTIRNVLNTQFLQRYIMMKLININHKDLLNMKNILVKD